MSDVVGYERSGRIGVITVDSPPVNALSYAVRTGLEERFAEANADEGAEAIVLICAGRTFHAGADISEFGKEPQPPHLPEVILSIENSPKLTVAAIHGTAFGGGLETAMGCDFRCAVSSAKVGQPEIKLGILPGAGGTQRLPRLAGVPNALQMIVSGDPVKAPKAHEMGVIDEIIEGDLLEGGGRHRVDPRRLFRRFSQENRQEDPRLLRSGTQHPGGRGLHRAALRRGDEA
jgi:3-hydroxyacyl-CoA dehydrogenase